MGYKLYETPSMHCSHATKYMPNHVFFLKQIGTNIAFQHHGSIDIFDITII